MFKFSDLLAGLRKLRRKYLPTDFEDYTDGFNYARKVLGRRPTQAGIRTFLVLIEDQSVAFVEGAQTYIHGLDWEKQFDH